MKVENYDDVDLAMLGIVTLALAGGLALIFTGQAKGGESLLVGGVTALGALARGRGKANGSNSK